MGLRLSADIAVSAQQAWQTFINAASSREAAGEESIGVGHAAHMVCAGLSCCADHARGIMFWPASEMDACHQALYSGRLAKSFLGRNVRRIAAHSTVVSTRVCSVQ